MKGDFVHIRKATAPSTIIAQMVIRIFFIVVEVKY
jgi:hypothetical protein